MSYKITITALNKSGLRLLAAAACAMLIMTSAEALKISADGGTMYIDFTAGNNDNQGYQGYWNEFIVDDFDWVGPPGTPPFDFVLSITGEYYAPSSPPGSESVNFIPPTWTPVNDADPDFNQIGVYVGSTGKGLGLSSSGADLYRYVDGCQDEDCNVVRWEALKFSFDTPVRLTVIGFASAGSTDDFNLTVINGAATTHPYTDVTPGDGLFTLSASQVGTDFRLWVDYEDDDFYITGLKIEEAPASILPGDLAPRGAPNGVLDAADVLILTRLLSGAITATPDELLAGDLNSYAGLDAGDLVLLNRVVLGLTP